MINQLTVTHNDARQIRQIYDSESKVNYNYICTTENLISERNNNNVSRDDIQWTLVNHNNIIVNNNDT